MSYTDFTVFVIASQPATRRLPSRAREQPDARTAMSQPVAPVGYVAAVAEGTAGNRRMRLAEAAERSFARHETFHPRYSWFRKAYSHVNDDPRIFSRPDAPVEIGVGKNMVRAIRFWGTAARLITDDPAQRPGARGEVRAHPQGPGAVRRGRLGSLHGGPGHAVAAALAAARPEEVETAGVVAGVQRVQRCRVHRGRSRRLRSSTLLDAVPQWPKPHPNSVRKDISALLRTYAPADRTGRARLDDMLDCPLRELNLLGRSPATGKYRFTLGPKPTLPSAVVAYAVLDYMALTGSPREHDHPEPSRPRTGCAGTVVQAHRGRIARRAQTGAGR